MDVLLLWGKGRLVLRKLWAATDTIYQNFHAGPTGVPDPEIPPDTPYNPDAPPSPTTPDGTPTERLSGALLADGDGVTVGTVSAGAFAGIAVYQGGPDQLPDAVVEAAVDALYGEGSTPAYRGRATTRLSNFYLTRYQDVFPPMSGLLEHAELKTLADIFGHMCERVGLTSDDYDFSDLASIGVRGFIVSPPYTPKEVMTALGRAFNVYFYEADKIYGLRATSAPTFSVADSELGWVDEVNGDETVLPELGGEVPVETSIPRRVSIRYYDPARNYEQNIQGEPRMITTGQREDVLELQLVMTADEAREAAQRELYQEDVEAVPHTFSLSYEHVYRNPGDVVTVTRAEGFTHQIRITSIKPGWTVECEGVAIDTAVYTQPIDTTPGDVFETPPVSVPGQTILGFYDGGALRTQEEGRPGYYLWGVKRTGDGEWRGAAVYKETPGDPQLIATLTKEATTGVAVTKLGAWSDTTVEDSTRPFTADAGTDTLTATAHELENDETVMVSNTGGVLPGGLSAATLYRVINRTANTLQLSLTSGGSAADITSAGTGTHSVQRVVDVDLYGTEATLESVTADQIARGDMAMLWGNEVVQPRTSTLVAGFTNRWRTMNFTRGRINTEGDTGVHAAGERILLLDDAVQFVEQDVAALNVASTYRAVTAGQSYDDAAPVDFTWAGGAMRASTPVNGEAERDIHNAWRVTWDSGSEESGFVSQGQEVKVYQLAVLDADGNTVRGPVRVDTAPDEAAKWEAFSLIGFPCTNPATSLPDGTISHVGSASEVGCIYLSQIIRGDCSIRFEVSEKIPARSVQIINHPSGTTTQIFWETALAGSTPTIAAAFDEGTRRPLPGEVYAIEIERGHAVYRGPSRQVMFRSGELPLEGAYRIQVSFGLLGGEAQELKRVTIRPAEPEIFVYTEEMQIADFGAVQDEITFEVRAVSLSPLAPLSRSLIITGEV